ncbi:MAG: collagen-like triple helix repeat-containing protein [Rhodoglobus sp.]
MKDWRARGADVIAVAGVIGVIAFATYLTVSNNDLRGQLQASQANAQQLYEQLLDEGVAPEAERPAEVISGAPGERGPKGEPGKRGFSGATGPQGVPGERGLIGLAGIQGAPGEAGKQGIPGVNGANGINGVNGRGITTVSCVLNSERRTVLRFTFTDSTAQDVPAPCIPVPVQG